MKVEFTNELHQSIFELANLMLVSILALISVLAAYVIWHMRVHKMREYRKRKYFTKGDLSDRLDLTTVLPNLTRDEMRRIAVEDKAVKDKKEEIDLEQYEGLPLNPKVYFDPEKDKADKGREIKPKIVRSFLSNEPLPKQDGDTPKQSVEAAYKSNQISWEWAEAQNDEDNQEGEK